MSTDQFQLDTERKSTTAMLPKWMLAASQAGKGPVGLLWDLSRRMLGKSKLQVEEYFLYGLYDDSRYTDEAKDTFVGVLGPKAPTPWAHVAGDKPTLTALLRGLDLPVPEIQAVAHETRSFGGAHTLKTREDARRFLQSQARYPIFGKPFDSVCSLGTASIKRYEAEEDVLVFAGDKTTTIDAFLDQVESLGWSYQFQTLLQPHPDVVPIVGDRVSTVRMFVLSDKQGCELLRASWKIPAPDNGADNFWREGNMLAGIDVETGRIVKAVRRTEDGVEPITTHPATGANFEDLVFPEWDAMRDVVLSAAHNIPECYTQGWDVALTDRGPVLVELEGDGGDPIMEQLCFETGLWQGRYREFMENVGQMKKELKQKRRDRGRKRFKRQLAQIRYRSRPVDDGNGVEIDAEEVQAALCSSESSADSDATAAETTDKAVTTSV